MAIQSPAAFAAAALPPSGLVAAILKDSDIGDCAAKSKLSSAAFVAKSFDLEPLTLESGERMTVAVGVDACVCAAQNCPTLVVLAQPGGAYRTVLSDFSIDSKILPDGSAVLTSHDSADLSDRETYQWNGKAYVLQKRYRISARFASEKPLLQPLAFAPGASSATLRGTAAYGFGDTYAFRARAGQTLTLALSAPTGKAVGSLLLFRGDTLLVQDVKHWSGKLPAGGEYKVGVEGASDDSLQPYVLKVTIR